MLDRKSSQGYIMLLFGGLIAWKANKQDTVTTSTLILRLDELLIIECDNKQTLRLVTEDSMKLLTRLHHVDIHNHWLRQEHSE